MANGWRGPLGKNRFLLFVDSEFGSVWWFETDRVTIRVKVPVNYGRTRTLFNLAFGCLLSPEQLMACHDCIRFKGADYVFEIPRVKLPTIFNPENFLRIAKDILTNREWDFQTRIRTAIGRAYYAAFLLSMIKQQSRGHPFGDKQKIHQLVIDSLHDDRFSHIADKLDKLRDYRVEADYRMYVNFTNVDGDKCVRLSANILRLLDGI